MSFLKRIFLLHAGPKTRGTFFAACVLLYYACAPAPPKPAIPPYSQALVDQIVSLIRQQDKLVQTFVATGDLTVDVKGSDWDADILMVGIRDPFRMKMEITHAWGKPILHVLVMGKKIQLLSFREKRLYRGELGMIASNRLFPGGIEADQIWSLCRGYPTLVKHHRAVSLKGNQISMVNREDDILQNIEISPSGSFPSLVTLPGVPIKMFFSHFDLQKDIQYARTIRLEDAESETSLALKIREMIPNRDIPEDIFQLNVPKDYKRFLLKKADPLN